MRVHCVRMAFRGKPKGNYLTGLSGLGALWALAEEGKWNSFLQYLPRQVHDQGQVWANEIFTLKSTNAEYGKKEI